jgi:hypothetical protein
MKSFFSVLFALMAFFACSLAPAAANEQLLRGEGDRLLDIIPAAAAAAGCCECDDKKKVDVCHQLGNGNYRKLTIASSAVEKHMENHDDEMPHSNMWKGRNRCYINEHCRVKCRPHRCPSIPKRQPQPQPQP